MLRIGELSRRLGVSDHVLRAWESRYGLLQPVRSPGGFRLYSEADESRIRRMQAYLADGLSAAEAARAALDGGASSPPGRPAGPPAAAPAGSEPFAERRQALDACPELSGQIKNPQRHQARHRLPRYHTSLRHDQRSSTGPATPDTTTPKRDQRPNKLNGIGCWMEPFLLRGGTQARRDIMRYL
jgi:DNA-binding transcriptional MerR regulator